MQRLPCKGITFFQQSAAEMESDPPPGFEPRHANWLTIAGILIAAGFSLLVFFASTIFAAPAPWVVPYARLFGIVGLGFTLTGAYVIAATYTGWPMPEPNPNTRKVASAVAILILVVSVVATLGTWLASSRSNAAAEATPVPSIMPTEMTYGYLALSCKWEDEGRGDMIYVLYQSPDATRRPRFDYVSRFKTNGVDPKTSYYTCVLHNDGPQAAYNVYLNFAYKITWAASHETIALRNVDYSPILVKRVPAGGSAEITFLNDLPGKDYFIAPGPQCAMDVPGSPGQRERCVLPRNPNVVENLLQNGVELFHYRSRTNCSGFTPPLIGEQKACRQVNPKAK